MHRAITALLIGDPLGVRVGKDGRWELLDRDGRAVSRLSRSFRPPFWTRCRSAEVFAVVGWSREASDPKYRDAMIPRRHEMQRLGGGRSRAGIRVGSESSRTVPRCRQRPKLSRHSMHADNSAGVAKLVDERESSVIIWQQ